MNTTRKAETTSTLHNIKKEIYDQFKRTNVARNVWSVFFGTTGSATGDVMLRGDVQSLLDANRTIRGLAANAYLNRNH